MCLTFEVKFFPELKRKMDFFSQPKWMVNSLDLTSYLFASCLKGVFSYGSYLLCFHSPRSSRRESS